MIDPSDIAHDSYHILEDALMHGQWVKELRDRREDMDKVSENYDLFMDDLGNLKRELNDWIQTLSHHRKQLEEHQHEIDHGEVRTRPV